jgi:UDP-glucuronate 4-epimerase
MKILVTGSAGFIGFHTAKKFVDLGHDVIGIDNINDYYAVSLKYDRLKCAGIDQSEIHYNTFTQSNISPSYRFMKMDLEDAAGIMLLFKEYNFDLVIHLAAQAGVRYSLENPKSYIQSNVVGFMNILEACRHYSVNKLVYASSSSVYGLSEKSMLSVTDRVDKPVSLYAASKKANELMAHVYSHLYGISTIGLRFFTVYGPWGRPDMAPFIFSKSIISGEPIKVFNHGNLKRDFTYIDDIIEGIAKVSTENHKSNYEIYNIGNSQPINVLNFIQILEKELGVNANKNFVAMQPGDVKETWADISELVNLFGYEPKVKIEEGVKRFIKWYKEYYN